MCSSRRVPHHGAVAFGRCRGAIFEVMRYLGVADRYNRPKACPIPPRILRLVDRWAGTARIEY